MPDGNGVVVTQAEASVTVDDILTWMPNSDHDQFIGKTFTYGSGQTPGVYSGHADSVGNSALRK